MLDRNILKESIERSKREMIYLYYYKMDMDDFKEAFNVTIIMLIEKMKKSIPILHLNQFIEKSTKIDFHIQSKELHHEAINSQNQHYIENIFDDIFDDSFFELFNEWKLDDLRSMSDVINNFFLYKNTLETTDTLASKETAYVFSENVDKYLEQYATPINENTNNKNQEIDIK